MKLRRSVILAFCVIVVLATAGILIAHHFRAAMFDRTSGVVSIAPDSETAGKPQEDAAMQAEASLPSSSTAAEEQIETPAMPQEETRDKPAYEEPTIISETDETKGTAAAENASESTSPETTAISDTESNEPKKHSLIAEYDILGYRLYAETDGESVKLLYPEWIGRNDVDSFFVYENSRYCLAEAGYSYSVPEDGIAVIMLPSVMSNEEIRNELDILVSDLLVYLQPDPEPEQKTEEYISTSQAIEEMETVAIEPEPAQEGPAEPALPIGTAEENCTEPLSQETELQNCSIDSNLGSAESGAGDYANCFANAQSSEGVTSAEESSQKGFTLLIKGGVLTAFDGVWSPEFGIGLDFSRMAAMGDTSSFGLRSDISVNLFPVLTRMAGVYDGMLLLAAIPSCSIMGSADLKLMMDFAAGPADIYLGGGLGGAIGSAGYNSRMSSYFGYEPAKSLRLDWFASAIAGVRFMATDMISIGAEASYRYMIGSGKHMLSADIVFGVSF